MKTPEETIGLECDGCGNRKTLTIEEAHFSFVALVQWCCPRCLTTQPWPTHLLEKNARPDTGY